MTRDRLRAIGTAVYGKNWKSAMAVDVYVSRITIDNWDIGRHPPPGDIGGRLLSALRARRSGERRLAKQRDAELGKADRVARTRSRLTRKHPLLLTRVTGGRTLGMRQV